MVVNVLLQISATVNLGGMDLHAVQVTLLQFPHSWESVQRTSHSLKFGTMWLRQQWWAAAYCNRAPALMSLHVSFAAGSTSRQSNTYPKIFWKHFMFSVVLPAVTLGVYNSCPCNRSTYFIDFIWMSWLPLFLTLFLQQCVSLCVSMVVPVLSQMFASVHKDSLVPNVRMVIILIFSFSPPSPHSCHYEEICEKTLLS